MKNSRSSGRSVTRSAGFTLVELLVALALAAIISVSIAVISSSAQKAYEETTRKVEIYNKFRFALLSLEQDLSKWIVTSNLEFFSDGKGAGARRNEQWDPGEELPDQKPDDHGPGVIDGGIKGEYDEFAYIQEQHYIGAAINDKGEEVKKVHDAYQIYFRTFTYIDGRMREANVEYKLLDPNHLDEYRNPQPPTEVDRKGMADLALYKIVRYHDISYENDIAKPTANYVVTRRFIEVCTNITDFKVEYTADNRFNSRATSGFRTPREDSREEGKPAEEEVRALRVAGLEGQPGGPAYRKTFGYGSVKIDRTYERATAFRAFFGDRQTRAEHRPVRFGWERNPLIQFAELTPGDKIFIFTPANRGAQGGGAQAPVGTITTQQMPSGTYTVKTNLAGRLELVEDVESTTWTRDQTGLYYKAAFLPEAVRISLRVVDDSEDREPRTLQKVIWVRQKAR
jgi:prepilin-type N-terminal cleavage/methylation domain-containing protein